GLHGRVELELVFVIVKAVAFVVLDQVFDLDAALAQRLYHLVAFGLVDARILRPLGDQQRGADAVDVQRRRGGGQALAVALGVADHVVHLGQQRLPVGRNGVHEGEQVGDADVIDGGGVEVRREGDAGQGGVAAVAAAIDADAGRI